MLRYSNIFKPISKKNIIVENGVSRLEFERNSSKGGEAWIVNHQSSLMLVFYMTQHKLSKRKSFWV